MTQTNTHKIELINASLAEKPDEITQKGTIVGLGYFKPQSLMHLRVDNYQREVLSARNSDSLYTAVKGGEYLPPITVGVRSQDYKNGGNSMFLPDACYIIDGVQRRAAILTCFEEDPVQFGNYMIGADIRFGTSYAAEKRLFHILNLRRTSLSPNVTLRNLRDKFSGIAVIFGMSANDKEFALYQRIQWTQRSEIGDLIGAMTVARTAIELFRHVRPDFTRGGKDKPNETGRRPGTSQGSPDGVAVSIENRVKKIGLQNYRESIATLFELIDQCWGIRELETSASRPHLKTHFLRALSMVLSEHKDFWKGNKLVIAPAHRERLKQLPLSKLATPDQDNNYAEALMLSQIIIRHLNRGKSINKLHPREKETE